VSSLSSLVPGLVEWSGEERKDILLRCILSLTTRYACSSLTICKPELKSRIACSTGAICSSSPRYIVPWTLNLFISARLASTLSIEAGGGDGVGNRNRRV
jgi:hypothetical protein